MVEPLDLSESYIAELRVKISRYKEEMCKTNSFDILKRTEILGQIHAIQSILDTDEREKHKNSKKTR
jgi:hypothetical protein